MSRILASWSLFLVLIKIFSLDCETFCFHKVLYIVGTKLTTKKNRESNFWLLQPRILDSTGSLRSRRRFFIHLFSQVVVLCKHFG